MNNKDIIKQYVDTGIILPKYQLEKLNLGLLKTYFRKRMMSIDIQLNSGNYERNYKYVEPILDEWILYYEYEIIQYWVELLEIYVSRGYFIAEDVIKGFPKEILNKYLNKRIEVDSLIISNDSEENMHSSYNIIAEFEFKLMNNDHIKKCIDLVVSVSKDIFETLSDSIKYKYISNIIKKFKGKNINLKNYQLRYIFSNKKLEERFLKSGIPIVDSHLDGLSHEQINLYLNNRIKSLKGEPLFSYEIRRLDNDMVLKMNRAKREQQH